MPDALEELLGSLLYEGYALYPYTPGATKNATPTPFGIVYPPAYAATVGSAHRPAADRGRRAGRPTAARVEAEVRFLRAGRRAPRARPPSDGSRSARCRSASDGATLVQPFDARRRLAAACG